MLKRLMALSCIFWGATCLAGSSNDVAGNPADLDALRAILKPLASLSADFTQTVVGADGYELQQLQGHMVVARPGKIHWQSEDPYPQTVVSDAKTLWLYDPDLEQVTIRPFEKDISRTPAILFIGEVDQLETRYAVQVDHKGDSGGLLYWLTPLDSHSLYQKLGIEFEKGIPTAMTLWDTLGQQTRIELHRVMINQPVADGQFTFDIPPDVDILYDN